MKNIDVTDHWIKDVKYGEVRGRIIIALLDLMDKKYQEENWPKSKGKYGYDTYIGFAVEMFFDELLADNYLEKNTYPKEDIGDYYKTEQEAKIFIKLCKIFDALLADVFKVKSIHSDIATDEEYTSSPLLPELRKSAKEAFAVFMANEKDNNEFCNFVLQGIKDNRSDFEVDEKLPTYQNICKYIDSVKEF